MYILPGIVTELHLYGVYDRGVSNKERILLKSQIPLNTAHYALLVGYRAPEPNAAFIYNNFFYTMGDRWIDANTWLWIYTGSGSEIVTQVDGQQMITTHWGNQYVLFTDPNVVPVLTKLHGIVVEQTASTLLLANSKK